MIRNSSLRLLRLLALLATFPCHAQHMNQPDSPCPARATAELVNCLAKAKDQADGELNALYQKLRKRLDPADTSRLLETQRVWIKYRDANCQAERELYGGGTGAQPAYLACVEAMTRARTKELRVTYVVKLKD
ncbi:MAG TPA: lysozyme inhibitor LprI family protein [Candidatus Sulfotelmatobacter sp.]|nr:lysozyme inhibitor LprI family protein [Candidatus Sulfotelmatobacter sp.]